MDWRNAFSLSSLLKLATRLFLPCGIGPPTGEILLLLPKSPFPLPAIDRKLGVEKPREGARWRILRKDVARSFIRGVAK